MAGGNEKKSFSPVFFVFLITYSYLCPHETKPLKIIYAKTYICIHTTLHS